MLVGWDGMGWPWDVQGAGHEPEGSSTVWAAVLGTLLRACLLPRQLGGHGAREMLPR